MFNTSDGKPILLVPKCLVKKAKKFYGSSVNVIENKKINAVSVDLNNNKNFKSDWVKK